MTETEEESEFFGNFRKLITVVDKLADAGLNEHISLPRITVLGGQSAGKSSLLEMIVGMNFLPRGSGIVTRRPLELRLVHIPDPTAKPYGVFGVKKDKKLYDFKAIHDTIIALTNKICGNNKNIVDKPITLSIFSHACPDLTIIDLPGITKVSIEDQDEDIEKITKTMATRYCKDDRTIILCVIPANQDITNSDGLQLAKKLDKEGIRTIGVITKIDIMDKGTNARDMLLNKVVPLKLGYIGAKGRSQDDINRGMTLKDALVLEQKYFSTHKIYSHLPKGHVGTGCLVTKLTTVMYKHIRRVMPSIISEIDLKTYECENQIKDLGNPLPVDKREKLLLLWKLISKFIEKYKMSIGGAYNVNQKMDKDLLGGAKIKLKFNELYLKKMSLKYKASRKLKDRDIVRAIKMHTGDSLPGFISCDAFLSLINPLLEKLRSPALDLIEDIHSILEQIAVHYVNETFSRFPNFLGECSESALLVIQQEKEKAQELIEELIDSYVGYNYTKDPEYISVILPNTQKKKLDKEKKEDEEKKKKEEEEKKKKEEEGDKKKKKNDEDEEEEEEENEEDDKKKGKKIAISKEKARKKTEQILIREMRVRIDTYFRVVVTQLADMIPRMIGHKLVNAVLV